MAFFNSLKDKFSKTENPEQEFTSNARDEYVELATDVSGERSAHTHVKPFTLEDFEDIKPILDALREGNVVAVIHIKPLKEKELTELKRAIAKLRKTCDALEGHVAGFTEDIVIATSTGISINKSKQTSEIQEG